MAKKKFLLLFLLCSLLPLAFAQAFLSLGWFGGATTTAAADQQQLAHGSLLPPFEFRRTLLAEGGHALAEIRAVDAGRLQPRFRTYGLLVAHVGRAAQQLLHVAERDWRRVA